MFNPFQYIFRPWHAKMLFGAIRKASLDAQQVSIFIEVHLAIIEIHFSVMIDQNCRGIDLPPSPTLLLGCWQRCLRPNIAALLATERGTVQ